MANPLLAIPAAAVGLILAFSNSPLSHAPKREKRETQLDRPFFVDSMVRLVSPIDLDIFPRETATPLYDAPSKRLYVGTHDGAVRCLLRGEIAWTTKVKGGVLATPLLDRENLYVPAGGGELVALNRITGQRRWAADVKEELTTQPTVAEGHLFVVSSEEAVTALTLDGKLLWKFRREPATGFTIRGNARPKVAHGLLYAGFADGNVAALTLDQGVARWMRNVSGVGDYLDVDSIEAPADDARVYVASAKAGIVALDAKTGEPAWTYALPGANQVLVDGARIFAAGKGALVGLSRLDGRKLWQFSLGNDRYALPLATTEGVVLAAVERGPLWAIEADTGRARGAFDPGHGFSQGPLALRGVTVVMSNAGALYTLGLLP
jgi:outer membrane protein assembly factor BamB